MADQVVLCSDTEPVFSGNILGRQMAVIREPIRESGVQGRHRCCGLSVTFCLGDFFRCLYFAPITSFGASLCVRYS